LEVTRAQMWMKEAAMPQADALVGIRRRPEVNAGQVDEFCDAAGDGLAQARLWPRGKLRPPGGLLRKETNDRLEPPPFRGDVGLRELFDLPSLLNAAFAAVSKNQQPRRLPRPPFVSCEIDGTSVGRSRCLSTFPNVVHPGPNGDPSVALRSLIFGHKKGYRSCSTFAAISGARLIL
jgi:hypothetical protein